MALTVQGILRLNSPGRFADGGGLYVCVRPAARNGVRRTWAFRYMVAGRATELGMGPVALLSLADAREEAAEYRKALRLGIDPLRRKRDARDAQRAETAQRVTFQECAGRFIEAHKPGWRNPKHGDQWTATLKTYAYPVFGDLPVGAVDTGLVLKVLEPIWTMKTETASRVRGRIESVLDWAKVRGYRAGENPARWRGHLDKMLPARSKVARVEHHKALPYADVPAFCGRLRSATSISAKALEFLIMTGSRTGEVILARWPEVDLSEKVWTVPGDRMKGGREHRVPLSDRAVAILKSLPREDGSEFLFLGGTRGKPLSSMAMLELLRGMLPDSGTTTHGFRSTFRDWAAEQTSYPGEVAEAALAHVVGDKVEAAYRRGDLFEKRRKLMRDWARYLENNSAGTVTRLRPRQVRS